MIGVSHLAWPAVVQFSNTPSGFVRRVNIVRWKLKFHVYNFVRFVSRQLQHRKIFAHQICFFFFVCSSTMNKFNNVDFDWSRFRGNKTKWRKNDRSFLITLNSLEMLWTSVESSLVNETCVGWHSRAHKNSIDVNLKWDSIDQCLFSSMCLYLLFLIYTQVALSFSIDKHSLMC